MNLTTRALPPEEWFRLEGTELETVWPHLTPQSAMVLVAEEDGAIVGTWAAIWVPHLEGIWIAPSHRGTGGVARRLLRAMGQALAACGARTAFTGALTPDVAGFAERLGGVPLQGQQFVITVKGAT